jgi:hypothetical protein
MSSAFWKSSVTVVVALAVVTAMAWDAAARPGYNAEPQARKGEVKRIYPDHYSLRLAEHPQETDNWCWASSSQMVLEYFGRHVTQSEMANAQFRRRDCGKRPVPGECNKGASIMLREYGLECVGADKTLTELEIAEQIAGRKNPIIFCWSWTGGGAHVLVACGYSKLKNGTFVVEVLDPAPPPLKDDYNVSGGRHSFVTYSRWLADKDHKLTHVDYNIGRKR